MHDLSVVDVLDKEGGHFAKAKSVVGVVIASVGHNDVVFPLKVSDKGSVGMIVLQKHHVDFRHLRQCKRGE